MWEGEEMGIFTVTENLARFVFIFKQNFIYNLEDCLHSFLTG